jgi:GH24 family phage-related lysozyme (muramidase)
MKRFNKFIQENYVNEQVGRKAAIAAAVALAPGIAYAGDHTVKSGDTLSALAQKHGTTVEDLAKRNKIADPNKIQIGQTINFADKKKTTAPKATPEDPATNTQRFARDLAPHEGYKSHVYKDHKGNPTIGIGHMFGSDSKKRFESAGLGDKYEGCVGGKCGLSKSEATKLLSQDITDIYLPRTKKLITNFDTLNPEAQSAAVGSVYRGGLSGSPKTVGLINQGKFKEASAEFINNKEYKESKKAGTGVYKRMDTYSNAFSNATTGNKS